jgi:hypothetical protein
MTFKRFWLSLKLDLRRVRDSNPRYPFGVYTLSRRAPSTTRTTLPGKLHNAFQGGKNIIFF